MTKNHLMPTYAPLPFEPIYGEGVWLTGKDGRRYLDMGAGVAVNSFGHCYPPLVKALQEQATKIWHASNLYELPLAVELAEKLCALSFADNVFFANSGLEAMEGCIKLARRFQSHQGHTEKWRILTFEGAFHGRSLATLAAGNQAKHMEGLGPKMDGFDQVAFGDMEAVKKAITKETAAILIEPVQGESGIKPHSREFLQNLRQLCDEKGLLLIFDEVQCGIGRTGHLFAYEYFGVTPDIMGLAKGLGGGFPIGAVLSTKKIAEAFSAGSHGSTFGGNPLATKVALTLLDEIMKDGFLSEVEKKAQDLTAKLRKISQSYPHIIQDVRGVGLMIGLVCQVENMQLYHKLFEAGLLLIPAGGNVLRFLPPLNVSKAEYDEALTILENICQNWPK